MKVLLYSRVSTSDQSTAAQLLELRKVAAQRDWEVLAEYEDVISGAKAERPALDAMIERVRAGGVDAVVSVKLDRIGRSMANFIAVSETLRKLDCGIICTSQGIDTTKGNACGELLQNLLMSIAQFERSLISERTKAGLAVARAAGKRLGRPSPKLQTEKIEPACLSWASGGRIGGLRALAEELGGVSPMTAGRVFDQWQSRQTVEEEAP